jgi:hypothetical protein
MSRLGVGAFGTHLKKFKALVYQYQIRVHPVNRNVFIKKHLNLKLSQGFFFIKFRQNVLEDLLLYSKSLETCKICVKNILPSHTILGIKFILTFIGIFIFINQFCVFLIYKP